MSTDIRSEISKANPYWISKHRYYELSKKIDISEQAALQTDSVIGEYILKGVISGLSYDSMKARIEIPCCKDMYYHLYRRFFWLLDRMRD